MLGPPPKVAKGSTAPGGAWAPDGAITEPPMPMEPIPAAFTELPLAMEPIPPVFIKEPIPIEPIPIVAGGGCCGIMP